MTFSVRDGRPGDLEAMVKLLPRLADYELPPRRLAADLWEGDAALLRDWSRGEAPQCFVKVAVDSSDSVVGVALVSLREELLSHAPSSHLEALAIAPEADGHGIGRSMVTEAEVEARARGALSMTLHVFGPNQRARHVYEQLGYAEELIRCIRYLD